MACSVGVLCPDVLGGDVLLETVEAVLEVVGCAVDALQAADLVGDAAQPVAEGGKEARKTGLTIINMNIRYRSIQLK